MAKSRSWLQLRHPTKTIKIWIMYLNVECVHDMYECNHCIFLFVCVLDKDSLRVKTSHAFDLSCMTWLITSSINTIPFKHRRVQESGPTCFSYWVSQKLIERSSRDCPSELKRLATGFSRCWCLVFDRWLIIHMWSTFSVCPTNCFLHFIHLIT